MKKTFILSLMAMTMAFSCQVVELNVAGPAEQPVVKDVTILAEPCPSTKVSYARNNDPSSPALVGTWEIGDVIYGFVEGGAKVSFSVDAVDASTGIATLSQTTNYALADGDKIYALYCPLKGADDIVGGELAIDFSAQEKSVVPMLLASEATVSGGVVSFHFRNLVSIVGILDPVVNQASSKKFTSITISGHNLVSSGKVSVVGGQWVFTGDAPSKFITKTLGLADCAHPTVSGARSIQYPIYLVVPAGPIEKVSILRQGYLFTYDVNKTATAGNFYKLENKEFTAVSLPTSSGLTVDNVLWAKCNFGATTTNATDLGTVHRWGEEKMIATRNANTGFYFDDAHSAGFSNYAGEIYWDGSAYTKYTAADGKTVLDPVDDIVQLTYPATGWRIPTIEEFNKLEELAIAGTLTKSYNPGSAIGAQYSDGTNSVFFRANQAVSSGGTNSKISGRFWTSTVDATSAHAYEAAYYFDAVYASKTCSKTSTGVLYRQYGLTIRPVRSSN